jgi:hypothetical protein
MSIQLHEAMLRWRKIKALKEDIEASLMQLLANPDATDEEVLKAKDMYKGVCTTYLDTKELLSITFPEKGPGGNTVYSWHQRG